MKTNLKDGMRYKSRFRTANRLAYLDTAAEGLPLDEARDPLLEYLADKSSGSPARSRIYAAEREAVHRAASMLGARDDTVALLGNSTEALNLLGNSIRWKPGDEVLTTDLEFSSGVVCWLRLKEQGVRLVVLPSRQGKVELADLTSRLGPQTRVVMLSQVSYKTGTQLPFLRELAQEAHRAGALLVVDATQALGRVPVSVEGVDFLMASSYKWLLGLHGVGVVYCAPDLAAQLKPGAAGWYSIQDVFAPDRFERFLLKSGASRFVGGAPNFPSIYVLRDSLKFLLQVGVERLDAHLRPLVKKASSGIQALGYDLLSPEDPRFSSGIVSFSPGEPEAVGKALRDAGVVVWAGDGRVRVSIHLYNDEQDVDALLATLKSLTPAALPERAL